MDAVNVQDRAEDANHLHDYQVEGEAVGVTQRCSRGGGAPAPPFTDSMVEHEDGERQEEEDVGGEEHGENEGARSDEEALVDGDEVAGGSVHMK